MKNDVLISSTRVYEGKIFKLDLDRIRFPDGTEGEMAVVRHPGASAIVPFLSDPAGEDPDLLLLRQYRYAAGSYLYEIPAGRLDPGESPLDCARRELREETGCTAAGLEELCAAFMTPGFADEKIHIFLASGLTRGETSHEADEFAEVQVVKMSRALAMIERGEMVDAKSIAGILFAVVFRLRRCDPPYGPATDGVRARDSASEQRNRLKMLWVRSAFGPVRRNPAGDSRSNPAGGTSVHGIRLAQQKSSGLVTLPKSSHIAEKEQHRRC